MKIFFDGAPEFDMVDPPCFLDENKKASDRVNHPSHYNQGGVECFDAMLASAGSDAVKNFCQLSCFKYIWRFQYKNGVEDLKKAKWYLEKLIELSELD